MQKKITVEQLKLFKTTFLQRQKAILDLHSKEELIDTDGDDVDLVQSIVLKNVADSLSQRDRTSLNKIKDALFRIENNTFGLCESCEEHIPEKRLLVIPECVTCVSCAEEAELAEKQYISVK